MKVKVLFVAVIAVIIILSIAVYGKISGKGNKETADIKDITSAAAISVNETDSTEPAITVAEDQTLTTKKISATTVNRSSNSSVATTEKTSATASSDTDDYKYAYAGLNPKPAVIDSNNWNLLLVNRNYILPENFSVDLANAAPGYDKKLDSRVAQHYTDMFNAAKTDGIKLVPLSGNRRISTQKTNFENKINYYINQGYDKTTATQKAAQIILPPGCSEHNAGLAMDICSLETSFEKTNEYKWLVENAADYGFILRYPKEKQAVTEITYEPWHWRYVGVETAKAVNAKGQCLEEYLSVN